MTIRHGKWFPPNWIGPVLPFQPVSRMASLGEINATDSKIYSPLKNKQQREVTQGLKSALRNVEKPPKIRLPKTSEFNWNSIGWALEWTGQYAVLTFACALIVMRPHAQDTHSTLL
jgi:hypothetical protein